MTQPTPQSPWTAVRNRLGGLFGRGSGPGPLVWAGVVLGVVLLVAAVIAANALSAPVHREGRPTASVTPIPRPTTATPTPSQTPSGTATATQPSSTPSATPSSSWPKVASSGKFDTAGIAVPPSGSSGTVHRYAVRVETSTRLNAAKVARQVADVLNDPRSWAGSGSVRFALVADAAKADFTITLAAPKTAGKLCTPDGGGSCIDSGDAVIDAAWWLGTAHTYASRPAWQAYLVNHAVGQLVGEKRQDCAKKGKPAPVMMPQAEDLGGCTSNPWPFP